MLITIVLGITIWYSCTKELESIKPNTSSDEMSNPSLLVMPSDHWYFGTPWEMPQGGVGCKTPCGPQCHVTYGDGGLYTGVQEFGLGSYSIMPNGKLEVNIDVSNLNPQHVNTWINSGIYEVQMLSEIPYQSIVNTYVANGLSNNPPQYFIPVGNWQINILNSTNPTSLKIKFNTMNSISVELS